MLHLEKRRRPLYALAALAAVALLAVPAPAEEAARKPGKIDNSLSFVPEDAAFYGSMLRNREQIEAVAKSHAWAKIQAMPAYKMLMQMAEGELKKPGNPVAQMLQLYQLPENRQLVQLLADMASDEIFIYGDQGYVDFLMLLKEVSSTLQWAPYTAQLTGSDPNKAVATATLKGLSANLERLKFPTLVIGFKLRDNEAAEAQLKRLEGFLEKAVDRTPPLKGRLKRTKIGDGSFLTLGLDGSLVPWDRISFEQYEEKPGQFDGLKTKLGQIKLTVSLGVREHYLLLSIGESNKHLENLGKGKALIGRPELKPLAKYADKRLISLGYVSKDLLAAAGTSKKDIDSMFAKGHEQLKKAKLPEELQTELIKDMDDLGKDIKSLMSEPGAVMSFAFLSERGQENYTYDWSEHPGLDGSKPLTALEHAGGSPLIVAMQRAKYKPDHYQLLVKWIKKANQFFEDIFLPKLNEDQKAQYEQFVKLAHPLLHRLDEATGKLLLPSLADGQLGLVVDGKLTSTKWFKDMPVSDKPLPVLEPALVLGVSDAEKLRAAFAEYRSIINDTLAALREIPGSKVPEITLPPAESRKIKAGTLYYYPLPPNLGLDPQIVPNAGLSDKVAVLSLSEKHSSRLLASTPLKVSEGPLADAAKQPLAGAVYVNWAGMVDLATPWVEYGFQMGVRLHRTKDDATAPGAGSKEEILDQVRTGLEILKVLRSISSCTYFEDGALVTHGEVVIKDLE